MHVHHARARYKHQAAACAETMYYSIFASAPFAGRVEYQEVVKKMTPPLAENMHHRFPVVRVYYPP